MSVARIACIAALALAPSARAADVFVSTTGDDANPGTSIDKPLKTLQKADSIVKPGDTVQILPGVYRNASVDKATGGSSLLEIRTSGTADAPITWKNYDGGRVELIAERVWNCINFRASYIVIDGLIATGNNDHVYQIDAEENAEIDVAKTLAGSDDQTKPKAKIDESVAPVASISSADIKKALPARAKPVAKHPADPTFNGNGINVDCRKGELFHHLTVRNCTVRKFGTVGISMISTDYFTIENNDIYDNAWYSRYGGSGISQLGGKAFDQKPGYHNVIRNNRTHRNKCLVRCLNTDCFSDGNGIILDSLGAYPGDVLVSNNLSYDNGGAGIHIFKQSGGHIDVVGNTVWRNQQMWPLYDLGAHSASNVRFANNVVYAGRGRQLNGEPLPGVTYDHNVYFGTWIIPTRGEGDVVADPMFVLPSTDANVADFHLRPGSPAEGRGTYPSTQPAK